MDLLRAVIFRPLQGDQHWPIQPVETVQPAWAGLKGAQHIGKHLVYLCRCRGNAHVAHMIVTADPGDPEQRLAIGAMVAQFETALVFQKGRAGHKED